MKLTKTRGRREPPALPPTHDTDVDEQHNQHKQDGAAGREKQNRNTSNLKNKIKKRNHPTFTFKN